MKKLYPTLAPAQALNVYSFSISKLALLLLLDYEYRDIKCDEEHGLEE